MPKYVVTEAQALAMKVMRDDGRMAYSAIGKFFGISGATVAFNISERRTRKYKHPHPFSKKETATMLRAVADRLDPPTSDLVLESPQMEIFSPHEHG